MTEGLAAFLFLGRLILILSYLPPVNPLFEYIVPAKSFLTTLLSNSIGIPAPSAGTIALYAR